MLKCAATAPKGLHRELQSLKTECLHPTSSSLLRKRRFLAESCPTSQYKSTIEHYPSGSVVARVLLTANPSVYTPVHESIAHCWREKEMIQPHPLV